MTQVMPGDSVINSDQIPDVVTPELAQWQQSDLAAPRATALARGSEMNALGLAVQGLPGNFAFEQDFLRLPVLTWRQLAIGIQGVERTELIHGSAAPQSGERQALQRRVQRLRHDLRKRMTRAEAPHQRQNPHKKFHSENLDNSPDENLFTKSGA